MPLINTNYKRLQAGYLFPEIAKRVKNFQEKNPEKEIIKMGIGDTVLPLAPAVVEAVMQKTKELGDEKSYTGYGDSEGNLALRKTISDYYQNLNCQIEVDDVFVSDGAKSDSANIAGIFDIYMIKLIRIKFNIKINIVNMMVVIYGFWFLNYTLSRVLINSFELTIFTISYYYH